MKKIFVVRQNIKMNLNSALNLNVMFLLNVLKKKHLGRFCLGTV